MPKTFPLNYADYACFWYNLKVFMTQGVSMLIDEVKASLAMENLKLTAEEEQLLLDYMNGLVSFEQVRDFIVNAVKNQKAA